jgi:hypothetical protein
MQKTYIALMLMSLLLFSGCIGGDGELWEDSGYDTSEGYDADYASYSAPMMAGEAMMDYGTGASSSSSQSKMVIQEGSIQLEVPEGTLEEKKGELSSLVSQYQGEVTYMSFQEYSYGKTYSMTVKISPNRFDDFTSTLSNLGEIKSMDTTLEDVTDEYTDIQTRIENLQEELARLNELYDQAENVEEILLIEREVTRVQTQLEIYQFRAEDLETRAAKSTVTIYLTEAKPAVETDFVMPLAEILNLFLGALSFGIIVIVGIAGFLIPIGIVAYVLRIAYRMVKGKNKAQQKGK